MSGRKKAGKIRKFQKSEQGFHEMNVYLLNQQHQCLEEFQFLSSEARLVQNRTYLQNLEKTLKGMVLAQKKIFASAFAKAKKAGILRKDDTNWMEDSE